MAPVSRLRRALRIAAGLAGVGLVATELAARATGASAPGLVLAGPELSIQQTPWGPTWHVGSAAMERRRAGCPGGAAAGDRHRVMLTGADWVHGGGLALDDAPGAALQRALAARADVPVCVETIAEPGLPHNAQLASLRTALYGETAEAVVWSVGPEDVWPAVAAGGAVHRFGPAGGLTGRVPLVPPVLLHSRALALALHRELPTGAPGPDTWSRFLAAALPEMAAAARAAGAGLLVVARPDTDRPFADQGAEADAATASLRSHCAAAGLPFLDLAAELDGTDPADLRPPGTPGPLDADGAETVAELVAPAVHRLLRAERQAVLSPRPAP